MKKLLPLILAAATAAMTASAQNETSGIKVVQDKFNFKDSLRLDCPKVSDQQMSGTCWCFSSLSFIESEMMHNGNQNPPNLSETFIVRQNYIDRAIKHVMLHGKMNFGQGSYFHDNTIIIRKNGIVPESAYPNNVMGESYINHYGLERELTRYVDSVARNTQNRVRLFRKPKETGGNRYLAVSPFALNRKETLLANHLESGYFHGVFKDIPVVRKEYCSEALPCASPGWTCDN